MFPFNFHTNECTKVVRFPRCNLSPVTCKLCYMVQFGDGDEQKHFGLMRKREAEELAQILSQKYGVDYVDLSLVAVNADALRLIPEAEARDAEAAAFGRVGKKVSVVVRTPEKPKTEAALRKLTEAGYEVTSYLGSEESL